MYLPNGQAIPYDRSGRGLKGSIDTWIAANVLPASDPAPASQAPAPSQRDAPPHLSLCFEVVRHKEYIAQPTDSTAPVEPNIDSTPCDDDNSEEADKDDDNSTDYGDLGGELYNMHEVLITEEKKHKYKPQKPQDTAPANTAPAPRTANATSSTSVPPHQPPANARAAPQYRYQSNAEDQKLIDQLFHLLLEGKVSQATPAQILAASPLIRKDLVKRLRTRRIEAGAFERVSTPTPSPLRPVKLTSFVVTAGPETALVASLVQRVAGGDTPKEEES
jgi:hypothetical protein